MPIDTVTSLVDAIRQHRLLEPPQLEEAGRLAAQPAFADPRALAKELLQRGWLTAYQVNQIFQGRAAELVLSSYLLLERLGEGGMGLVFKARHAKLGKIVALKIIRQDRLNNPEALRRFHREILVAAQLSHANVVHSYDADQVGDRHLIAMEYVDGTDLSRLVRERGRLPVHDACEYIRQAALGLQHAHEHGLVHRDIKPSNLLLAKAHGGPAVGVTAGVVKLLDLGLARVLSPAGEDTPSQLTQAGSLVGTPDFIAPEQARNAHSADIRADLYSLGCTLFFLLAGQPPFPGGSMTEKVLKHHWDAAPGVETLRAEVPPIVAAVVRKLLAKRPEDRFQTPALLAEALERVLAPGGMESPVPPEWIVTSLPSAEPIPAVPLAMPASGSQTVPHANLATPTSASNITAQVPPLATPVRRRSPNRPVLLLSAGFAAVILTILIAMFWPRTEPRPTTATARPTLATLPEVAVSPLDKLNRDRIPPAERIALQAKEVVAVLGEHRGRHYGYVRGVAFAPDGQSLVSAGDDGGVRLWDPATLQARSVLATGTSALSCLAYSGDGKTLAVGDWSGTVRLWDMTRTPPRDPLMLRHSGEGIMALGFAHDNQHLAVALEDYSIQFWEFTAAGQPRKGAVLRGHKDEVTTVLFSPDARHLATASQDHTIRLYEVGNGPPRLRTTLEGHTQGVTALAFSPKGRTLVSASDDGTFLTWDVFSKQVQRGEAVTLSSAAASLTFGPNRDTLICGLWDGGIAVYDISTAKPRLKTTLAETTGVTALAWCPKTSRLASGSESGTLRLWDWNNGAPREAMPPRGHTARVGAMTFAPDGLTLATGSSDSSVRLWELGGAEPKERAVLPAKGAISSVVYSPDGKRLAAGSRYDSLFRLWELPGTVPRTWPMAADEKSRAGAVAFLDNQTLVVGGRDTEKEGTIRFWDIGGKEPQAGAALRGHAGQVVALAVSKTGVMASSGGADQTVRVWDTARRRELHHFFGLKGGVVGPVALAADGKMLVYSSAYISGGMAGSDYSVFVWDLAAEPPKPLPSLPGHSATVRGVAFAPDGKLLATADDEGRLILWEPAAGKNLQDWRLPGAITSLTFAPDSRHLAVGNGNGTAYILRVKPAPRRP